MGRFKDLTTPSLLARHIFFLLLLLVGHQSALGALGRLRHKCVGRLLLLLCFLARSVVPLGKIPDAPQHLAHHYNNKKKKKRILLADDWRQVTKWPGHVGGERRERAERL